MADCKACGGWFEASKTVDLCPLCDKALKRLNGYAEVVVHCKDCQYLLYWSDGRTMNICDIDGRAKYENDFCSYAERRV